MTNGRVELASQPIVKVYLNLPKLNLFMPRTSTDVAHRTVMTNQESRTADGGSPLDDTANIQRRLDLEYLPY